MFLSLLHKGVFKKKKKKRHFLLEICFAAPTKSSSTLRLWWVVPEDGHTQITGQLHLKIIRLIRVPWISGQEGSLHLLV